MNPLQDICEALPHTDSEADSIHTTILPPMFKRRYLKIIFAVSLLITIGLPTLSVFLFYPSFVSLLIEEKEREAIRIANHISTIKIDNQVKDSLNKENINSLIEDIESIRKNFSLWKIKIFSSSGETVYSTNPMDLGKINEYPYFHKEVARGKPYTKAVKKGTLSLEDEFVELDVVEAYVPIMYAEQFTGAFEIYFDITHIKQSMNRLLFFGTGIMMTATLLLLVLLLFVLRRTAMGIDAHQQAVGRFQLLLESAGEGIIGLDSIGKVTFVNPAASKMIGYADDELIGMPMHTTLHDRFADGSVYPLEECRMEQAYRRGEIIQVENEVLWRRDGSSFPVKYISTPIRHDGKIMGSVVVFNDITERLRTEEALQKARDEAEQASRIKSDFLANMSHEIRTPMNAVIGFAELCLRTNLNAKQRDYLNRVYGSSVVLLDIVNDILNLSKIKAGGIVIESIPFELSSVLDQVVTLTNGKAHEKGLELLISCEQNCPGHLLGDPLRLGQILTNLVNNAVKFTERGKVALSVCSGKRTDTTVVLLFEVRDTGIGLSEEQQTHLFSPFIQIDSSITRRFGGTGLGLVMCGELVKQMGGQLKVTSIPGKGSTFFFNVEFGLYQTDVRIPGRISRCLRGKRVLVVDDIPTAREILRGVLEQLSFDVTLVASGEEALDMILQPSPPFDLALIDWKMPGGMDGLETIRRIREEQGEKRIPLLILVTAYTYNEVHKQAEGALPDALLSKPITNTSLLEAVFIAAEGVQGAETLLVDDNAFNRKVAGGNRTLWLRQLHIFFIEQQGGMEPIKTALRDGRHNTAKRLCHSLGKAACSINAEELQQDANELADSIGKKEDIDELLKRTEHELVKLLRHIQELPLVTAGSEVDSTSEQIEDVRKKLLAELHGFEFNAGKTLETLMMMVREPQLYAKLQEVKSQLDQFDFEAASLLLEADVTAGSGASSTEI